MASLKKHTAVFTGFTWFTLWPGIRAHITTYGITLSFLSLFQVLITLATILPLLSLWFFTYLPLRGIEEVALVRPERVQELPIATRAATIVAVEQIVIDPPQFAPQSISVLITDTIDRPDVPFLSHRFQLSPQPANQHSSVPLVGIPWSLARNWEVVPGDTIELRGSYEADAPALTAQIAVVYQPILLPLLQTRNFVVLESSEAVEQWQTALPEAQQIGLFLIYSEANRQIIAPYQEQVIFREQMIERSVIIPLYDQRFTLAIPLLLYLAGFLLFWNGFLELRSQELRTWYAIGATRTMLIHLVALSSIVMLIMVTLIAFGIVMYVVWVARQNYPLPLFWLSALGSMLVWNVLCVLCGVVVFLFNAARYTTFQPESRLQRRKT